MIVRRHAETHAAGVLLKLLLQTGEQPAAMNKKLDLPHFSCNVAFGPAALSSDELPPPARKGDMKQFNSSSFRCGVSTTFPSRFAVNGSREREASESLRVESYAYVFACRLAESNSHFLATKDQKSSCRVKQNSHAHKDRPHNARSSARLQPLLRHHYRTALAKSCFSTAYGFCCQCLIPTASQLRGAMLLCIKARVKRNYLAQIAFDVKFLQPTIRGRKSSTCSFLSNPDWSYLCRCLKLLRKPTPVDGQARQYLHNLPWRDPERTEAAWFFFATRLADLSDTLQHGLGFRA